MLLLLLVVLVVVMVSILYLYTLPALEFHGDLRDFFTNSLVGW